MSHGAMPVFTSPLSPDDDAGFKSMYTSIHLPQVAERVEGIACARRHELDDDRTGRTYLAVYELDLDDATVRTDGAMSSGCLDRSKLLQRDPLPLVTDADGGRTR